MQNTIYKLDGGQNFGKWDDPVSQLIYNDCMPHLIPPAIHYPIVADYGGANGLARKWFPNSRYITIDIDETKRPDVVDNIVTHRGNYDLIILRYVLHYLDDLQVASMFDTMKQYHKGDLLVIQFTNDGVDLETKKHVSALSSETAWLRSTAEFFNLLSPLHIKFCNHLDYMVTPQFYLNRLGVVTNCFHNESVYGVLCSL